MPTGVYTRKPKPSAPYVQNDDGSISIPLLARDGSVRAWTIIDAVDAEWVSRWRWSLNDRGYAVRTIHSEGRTQTLRLHRLILGLSKDDPRNPDHINRIKLDNRRMNLRALTNNGNIQNFPSCRGSTSAYRGVSWVSKRSKWTAAVRINGKSKFLGHFDSELEAAEVARQARAAAMPYATD